MKEIIHVIINKSFWIERSGHGFVLVEMVPSKDKDGNDKLKERLRFYGTVYQALHGFLIAEVDNAKSIEEVSSKVNDVMNEIKAAKEEIKAAFRIEVRTTK